MYGKGMDITGIIYTESPTTRSHRRAITSLENFLGHVGSNGTTMAQSLETMTART